METRKPLERILLVDDDDDDCFIFKKVITEIDPSIDVFCVEEGSHVLAALDRVDPQLIFLDINMPRINGHDCLRSIKDSRHRYIPIVMYSSSFYANDINISYGLGATLYFGKTGNIDKLKNSLADILQLKWQDPESITPRFYREGRYLPYSMDNGMTID